MMEAEKKESERTIKIKTECLRLTLRNLQDMLNEEKQKLKEEKTQVEGMAKEIGLVLIDTNQLQTKITPETINNTTVRCDHSVTMPKPKSDHVCHDYQVKHDRGDSDNCRRDIPQREYDRIEKGYVYKSFNPSSEWKFENCHKFQEKPNKLNHETLREYTIQVTNEDRKYPVSNNQDIRGHKIHFNNQTSPHHSNNRGIDEKQSCESDDKAINKELFAINDKRKHNEVILEDKRDDPTLDSGGNELYKFQNVISSTEEFIRNQFDKMEDGKHYMESTSANYYDGKTDNEQFLLDYYDRFQQKIKNNGSFAAPMSGDYQKERFDMAMGPRVMDPYDWSENFLNNDYMNIDSSNCMMDKPNLDWRQGDAGMNLPPANQNEDWEPSINLKTDLINSHRYTMDWLYKETTNVTADATYTVGYVNEIIDNSSSVFADDGPYITRTSYFEHYSSEPVFPADIKIQTDSIHSTDHTVSPGLDYSLNFVYPDHGFSTDSMHAYLPDPGVWPESNSGGLVNYSPFPINTPLNTEKQTTNKSPSTSEHIFELINEADNISQRIIILNDQS